MKCMLLYICVLIQACAVVTSEAEDIFLDFEEVEKDASGQTHVELINGVVETPYVEPTPPPLDEVLKGADLNGETEVEDDRVSTEYVPVSVPTVIAHHDEIIAEAPQLENATLNKDKVANDRKNNLTVHETTTTVEKNDSVKADIEKPSCPMGPPPNFYHGLPGRDGMPGRDGNPGVHGVPGMPGMKGETGSCDCKEDIRKLFQSGEIHVPNIHQCAWNKLSYALEAGKVQTCTFNKRFAFTTLKVEWYGATRILCKKGTPCCNRWYITFNGAECTNPMTIDGLIFTQDHNTTLNIHRASAIAGICSDLPKGLIDVALWTGKCDGIYPTGSSRTGWNSASRIIIQEIPVL